MRYLIEQNVQLRFDEPVREHHCELRLAPRSDATQNVSHSELSLDPDGHQHSYVDYFGNRVHRCDIMPPHERLRLRFRATVDTFLANPFDFPLRNPSQESRWLEETLRQQPRVWDYVLHRSELTPDPATLEMEDLDLPTHDRSLRCFEAAIGARDWVRETFTYLPEQIVTPSPLVNVIEQRRGGVRDLAHVLLMVLRRWGLPARYVSGYRDPHPDEPLDAVTPHAWVEVLVPEAGWRGLDCTEALVANDSYIAVAVGRDAHDVPPLRTHWKGGGSDREPEISIRLQRQQSQQ